MVNCIPKSWKYNEDMEMLLLFYQRTDELLSETSSDTYVLPQHNVYTLLYEIEEIYDLLEDYNLIEEHYDNYIIPIIEEFLFQTEKDFLVKQKLGKRLQSIRTGFEEAKTRHVLLRRWIDVFKQTVSFRQYRESYRSEIERLVVETKNKDLLQECLKNYYICLVHIGYAREYLYTSSKKFFDNESNSITNLSQVRDFLSQFNCKKKKMEFLLLMDTDSIDYLDSLTDSISVGRNIEKISIEEQREELCKDYVIKDLFREYDRLKSNEKGHKSLCIVKYTDMTLDPYSSAIRFNDQIRFMQSFVRYFKHFYFTKQIHKFLVKCDNGYYRNINLPHKLQKRPYIHQNMIDARIKNVLSAKSMERDAFISITHAIDMHAEALDSQNSTTLLKTFWTALETLFASPLSNTSRENVINSILSIIQKTYILKLLRELYAQLSSAIDDSSMNALGISSFELFVEYFSKNEARSSEMKKIYSQLSNNPLLRSRLFNMRENLKNGESIQSVIEAHNSKIVWQLKRLYRIRNVATHLGETASGLEIAVNHLHNYFDYAINYMLCKSENGDIIVSTASLVFEAKNDNRIRYEMLKSKENLSLENYQDYLFGPDLNLIKYQFEY